MRLISIILLFAAFSLSYLAHAQKYPVVVLPGEQKVLKPDFDTLWVLKDSQLKKAIIAAKKLKIADEINAELYKKVDLLEQKNLIKDSLIVDLKEDRKFYEDKWNTCQQDVDILIKQNKKQKLFKNVALAGVVVAFIAGFLIK
ncbi:MAG: hypothetical protein L3J74_10925 [Bacteroidales bacterium]|nr:hypothetical protein [Bacteroidales bacterium]